MLDPDVLAEIAGAILGWNTGLLVAWLTWPLIQKASEPVASDWRPAHGLLAMLIISAGVLTIAAAPRWQPLRQVASVAWWQTAGLANALALIWMLPALAGRAAQLENITRFAFRVRNGCLSAGRVSSIVILTITVVQGLNLLNGLALMASVGPFLLKMSHLDPVEAR